MPQDPINRLAKLRIIKASADLEIQLSTKQGHAPAIDILRRLRDKAAESLTALAFVDPYDAKRIATLQNEVKRYDEWFGEMSALIAEGKAYDREFDDAERQEILDILLTTPEGEREAINTGLIDDQRQLPDG